MDVVIKSLVEKLPEWSFHAIGVIICVAIILYIIKLFFSNKNIHNIINNIEKKDEKLTAIREQYEEQKLELQNSKTTSVQLEFAMNNITPYIHTLNRIRYIRNPLTASQEISMSLDELIDSLSTDIKSSPGEKHRSGIWSKDENGLRLISGSVGFDRSYIGNRTLDLDASIAGRCFRKKHTINSSNVHEDEDWAESQDPRSNYSSLICIPLGDWGVLTIDGVKPLSEQCRVIGELYASVINGYMYEYAEYTRLMMEMESREEQDVADREVSAGSS